MKKYRIEEEEQSFENDFPSDRPMDEEEISILMNGPAMFVILDRDGRKAQVATVLIMIVRQSSSDRAP